MIKVNDTKLDISIEGEGRPIIFINTYLASKKYWDSYVKNLKNNYKCITYDLRGHGESECMCEKYTVELFAEDLKQIILELKLSNITIVAHSVGALIALKAVEGNNTLDIRKFIFVSCSLKLSYPTHSKDIDAPHDITEVNNFYADSFCHENHPEVRKNLIIDWKKIKPLTYRNLNILTPSFPVIEDLDFMENIETILIYGMDDKIIPLIQQEVMCGIFKNAVIHKIQSAGHFVFMEDITSVQKIISNAVNN